jgi:hypothetical protein
LTELATKAQLLKGAGCAGYFYNWEREVYFNRKARKAFSVDFLEDNAPEEIERRIRETTPGTEWSFFFNSPPPDSVKRELARVLG